MLERCRRGKKKGRCEQKRRKEKLSCLHEESGMRKESKS